MIISTRKGFLLVLLVMAAPAVYLKAEQTAGVNPNEAVSLRTSYVLGPDDQIVIRALDAEEISDKPVRIDMSGYIRLPLAGRIRASGLTVQQLEGELTARLVGYIREPQITVSVTDFRSQPVSVIGAVKRPGVHQIQGRKTLVEMLSLAEGLREDTGHSIKITRKLEYGRIPLSNAANDPTGQYSVAAVDLKSIMEARTPEENILIMPYDVISVPRAEMVYVVGQVKKAGGFVLRERETVSTLQALSLAEGLDRVAAPQNARILRIHSETASRVEISVNLKKVLAGQAPDVPLQPEDILFVPNSAAKSATLRAVEAAIQMGTGVVVWRR